MDWFKRHPRFGAILGIVFVTMPQWAASVWSLFIVDKPMVPTVAEWIGVKNVPSPNVLGWVPTVVGLVLLVLVWEQTRGHHAVTVQPLPSPIQLEPGQVPQQPKHADAEDGRVFIEKGPRDLVAPFDKLTSYTADKLVSDYVGNWVRWTLNVQNVAQYHDTTSVAAYVRDSPQLDIYVHMNFQSEEKARVVHLEKGTPITVEGQIEKITMRKVELKHCRLVVAPFAALSVV